MMALACTAPDVGSHTDELATEGRWRAPAHILEEGDTQTVEYTGAGEWFDDERTCQGAFTEGGQVLRDYILTYFPQVYSVGGYSCRPIVGNPTQTSVHATGRALDLMIQTTPDDDADNDLGDPIAHWLIQNAERIGIQFIIWDRTTWGASRPVGDKEREYGGTNPHLDHLHIELSVEGGDMATPWFASELEPPLIDSCMPLPSEGGIIDDSNPCTQLIGPGEYWRSESGQGYGGSLVWTNAISGDERGNWARWQIFASEAGEYEVEVHGGSAFSVHEKARYELVFGQESSEFVVDQSAIEEWYSLGFFDFEVGGGQALEVFDNGPDPVDSDQHIAVDAIRVTATGNVIPDPGGGGEGSGEGESGGDIVGGCSTNGASGNSRIGLLFLVLVLTFRRRPRNA